MSSITRAAHFSIAFLGLLAGLLGCASVPVRTEASLAPAPTLFDAERVAHVLSRLTFGARAGDAERVAAMGVDQWVARQLRPETIGDSALTVALAPLPAWSGTVGDTALSSTLRFASMTMTQLSKDTAARMALSAETRRFGAFGFLDDFNAGKVAHAQVGERQLFEVIADFWENHFYIYGGSATSRDALIAWNRAAIRPHALGKFRDLLGAVGHSPAMLYYLDNYLSTRRGLNENYARELLELHTLGADGGYTQQDVVEVARALTGWSTAMGRRDMFAFLLGNHDIGSKTVLGHALPPGRGVEDGEEVLDILARHPSTARYISLKLARRLVSDEPPAALVERAAATFTRTDGDIAEVVRAIVTSPEFFSKAAFRAKVKTPFELVVSTRRVFGAPADTTTVTVRSIASLGQPTFGHVPPDGWPDKGVAWMNSGTISQRIRYAGDVTTGRVGGAMVERWIDRSSLVSLAFVQQVDAVVQQILGGFAEPATLVAMRGVRPTDGTSDARQTLREILAVALASPEFQRR